MIKNIAKRVLETLRVMINTFRCKRVINSVSSVWEYPLKELWRRNNMSMKNMTIESQIMVVTYWARELYGDEHLQDLNIDGRVDEIADRLTYYRNKFGNVREHEYDIPPLAIVMAEMPL